MQQVRGHETMLARFIEMAVRALAAPPGDATPTGPKPTGTVTADGFDFEQTTFEDWSEYTRVEGVATFTPTTAEEVVDVCNRAAASGYTVRAVGHSHNWSPLVLPRATPPEPRTVLIDTSKLVGASAEIVDGQVRATFGAGTTLGAATEFLESLDNQGQSDAPGYTFLNMPTPGGLTLGGILAVGGHGTSVPATQPEPRLMGCVSNMIVSFKAVTTDPDDPESKVYALREFQRSDPDASAFLVHLGRALLVEVTLAAVPNYYLQLTNAFPHMDEVMAPPTAPLPEHALASLLDAHGRVEVIWFPYQPLAWVQCNTRQTTKTGVQVDGPYNYGWMNWVPRELSDVLRTVLADRQALVPALMAAEITDAVCHMDGTVLNGTARDLEIYLTDDTLRMSAFGYVLQLPRAQVQDAVHEFHTELQRLLTAHEALRQYPVNGAVEIRCTTIDEQEDLQVPGAQPPALAATHSVDASDTTVDTVLWLDVLTFPEAPGSSQFFMELEQWMVRTWGTRYPGRLRPEWSKGWAYTEAGPWTDTRLITEWIPSVYDRATDGLTFEWAKQTLTRYDRADIFTNPFLDSLFS